MAVIQYTGLVTQLRGSIAGTTFSKTKQGFSAYKKGLPRKQKSPAQNAINAGFAANANLWRTLDSTARSNWATMAAAVQVYNRIGELINISAYNMYQLVSALINPTGSGTALTADGTTNPPYQFSIDLVSLEFESTTAGWQISDISIDVTTITNQTTACQVVFWISQPELSEESAPRDNWYRLASDTLAGNIGAEETENFQFSNIQLPPGFKVIPEYFYRVKAQMIQVNSKVFSLGVISPPTEATELPPYEFPTFELANDEFESYFATSGVNLSNLIIYWNQTANNQPSNEFQIEIRYRGKVSSNTWDPTTDELISQMLTPLGSSSMITEAYAQNSAPNQTAWSELNTLGNAWNTPTPPFWVNISYRFYNIPNDIYSEWQDAVLPRHSF